MHFLFLVLTCWFGAIVGAGLLGAIFESTLGSSSGPRLLAGIFIASMIVSWRTVAVLSIAVVVLAAILPGAGYLTMGLIGLLAGICLVGMSVR
ncbi:MAG TPA: hypothetical protein V6C81_12440 [Planktothrix sp.]|jgi:hypothetical protein